MAKKKLLLVVGAGASVEFGMPSVKGVRDIINAEAQRWYQLADQSSSNLYEHIEGRIKQYWNDNLPNHLLREPQFEDVLYAIFAVPAAYPAGAYTSALGALMKPIILPDFINPLQGRKIVETDTLRQLGCVLVDALVREFRELCKLPKQNEIPGIAYLQSLIMALQDEFEIAVVTLNYDNIIYRLLPGVEVGFDIETGRFEPIRITHRNGWPCMLHLHGSVHFDMRLDERPGRRAGLHEIHWQTDINASFSQNAFGRGTTVSLEGPVFPTSVVVAGYGKTTQLMRKPFRTYYAELDRLATDCDAVLVTGYGFGDPHLNMAFADFRDRRRPVVIIGWARDETMTISGAGWGDCDRQTKSMLQTFETAHHSMSGLLGHKMPDTVKELKMAEEFEVCTDSNTPIAVWYNGMLAACKNPTKVISRLR